MFINTEWHYAIMWEFRVTPEFQAQFEQVYGPHGEWAQFFRLGQAYFGTQLLRDESDAGRYITVDLWRSREDYEDFRQKHADEYRRIDQRCEQMTESERALGSFERVSPLS